MGLHWPARTSEYEVQHELHRRLTELGYQVRGAVPATCLDDEVRRSVFLDLVVFDVGRNPVLIIECKSAERGSGLSRKQKRKYQRFGLPLIMCWNKTCIPETIVAVQQVYSEPGELFKSLEINGLDDAKTVVNIC